MADVRRRLRFRRHLLALVLLVLLNELRHDLQGQSSGRSALRPERWTRVKRASAYEIHSEQPAGADMAASRTSAPVAVYQHNPSSDISLPARFLAAIQDLLPVINLDYDILSASDRFAESGKLDKQIDDYYDGKFSENMTLDELHLMSIRAAMRTAPTPLHTSWGYETRELSRLGSLPVLDDELCSLQLNHLAKRLDQALKQPATGRSAGLEPEATDPSTGISTPVDNFEARQAYKTGDLEIMRYLDTYGRASSDLLAGNIRWYGAYPSCLRMRLRPHGRGQRPTSNADQESTIKFRYCMGAYRSHGWHSLAGTSAESRNRSKWADHGVATADMALNHYFLRIGLCLPEACDSSALERPDNARSLERLLKFNLAKPFNSDHYKLTDLYCLPDSRSPLRSIPLAGKLLLVAGALWLALIVGATAVHLNVDKFYLKTVERIRREQARRRRSRGSHSAASRHEETGGVDEAEAEERNEFKESDILNVKLNIIRLNMYLREKSRQLIRGVDLVDCLSLYSNWLRYTKRVKLAIVEMHAREKSVERRRLRNECMVAASADKTGQALVSALRLNGKSIESAPQNPEGDRNGASEVSGKSDPMLERVRRQLTGGDAHRHPAETDKQRMQTAPDETKGQPGGASEVRVDTSSLNALKVVALVWIMAGHCIFYLGSAIANGALLKDILPTLPAFALANGALYITELFFIITGCLTAYLTFKRTTKLTECGQPSDRLELRERSASGSSSASSSSPSPTVRLDSGLAAGNSNNNGSGGAGNQKKREQQPLVAVMEGRLFRPSFMSLMVVTRYLRILPTYLLVYATVKLVSVYVGGSGQLWDYVVSPNSMRRACVQESWWPVLTLTSNYVDIYKHCIVGGWYLSADMQFALVSLPMILLLAHAQRTKLSSSSGVNGAQQQQQAGKQGSARSVTVRTAGGAGEVQQQQQLVVRVQKRLYLAYGLIVALGCLTALLSIVHSMVGSRVDLSYIVKFSPHTMAMLSQNIMMYTNSIFRFRAFAAGLILGHLLYCYEFKLIKLPKFVQQHGSKLAVVIFAIGFSIMFMPVFLHGKIILSHDMTALLMVLSAGGIDIFLSSLIFFICIGKAPKAILFALNSPLWCLLSSLSLSAFLVHTEIIIVLTSQLDPPPSASYSLLLFIFSATLLLTYGLALILYLTFEMPINQLIESLMLSFLGMNRSRRPVVARR